MPTTIQDDITQYGTFTLNGTLAGTFSTARANMALETLKAYELPITGFRVHDAYESPLPNYSSTSRNAIPVTYAWEPTLADSVFFVADRDYRVTAITMRVEVAGTDGGAVTAQIRKATSGTDIASGTLLGATTLDLKGTVDTNQTFTLSTTSSALDIAAGTAIGIDLTGTPTSARGTVTVFLVPVSADDLGIATGTFGTALPHIKTRELGTDTQTAYARIMFTLPPEYVTGTDVTLRFAAGMLTAVADTSADLDVSAYLSARTTLVSGSDLVTTAAQSMNSLTFTEYLFTVSGGTLTPGGILDIRVSIAIVDAATAAVYGAIAHAEALLTIRG